MQELYKWNWIDGPWIVASATVTAAPPWLKRGARASFGFSSFQTREIEIRGTRAEVVGGAFVNEVSVLSPGTKPAEPLAEVLSCRPAKPPPAPAAVHASGRAAVGEIFYGDGTTITRYGIGQVLAVGGERLLRTSSGQAIRRVGRD